MSANDNRVPRKRTSHKDNPARPSGREPVRKRGRGQAPERERASNRGRPAERERVSSRKRSAERERASSRGPVQERGRVSNRGRPPERERVSSREPVRKRGRAQTPERGRVSGRTPRRNAAPRRPRTPNRGQPQYRRRAPRRRRGGGFLSLLTRAAIVALIFLAVGKVGSPLVFQELQVYHPDRAAAKEETPAPAPDNKSLAAKSLTAASDIAAAAPESDSQSPADADAAVPERKDGFYTILLAGTDDNNGGSDTIILVGVDSKNHQIFGVSVPRDTKAIVKGKSYKINAAYKIGGMPLLAQTVAAQMSIPVDCTVEIDLQGFAALIDAIGGVDFEVPIDMDYEDPKQNLEIHVSQGLQHLDGETALKVVRFRHNSDGTGYPDQDLGRIRTQQKFLKAVAKSMLSFSTLTRLDDFVRIFKKYVKTDLTLPNLAWLGAQAVAAGSDGIQFATLPGTWKSPYIYTDRQGALDLINAHLNPYQEDRTLEDLHFPS